MFGFVSGLWDQDNQKDFPADFQLEYGETEEGALSRFFPKTVKWPREGGILFDDNILFDHINGRQRHLESKLGDQEMADLMAITGYKPKRKNLEPDGTYIFEESYDHTDIENLMEIAYNNRIDLYYVGGVENQLEEKLSETQRIEEYMDELRKIADPVEVEPIMGDGKIDPSIAMRALEKDLNIVTADDDFLDVYESPINYFEKNVYTVKTMLRTVESQYEL